MTAYTAPLWCVLRGAVNDKGSMSLRGRNERRVMTPVVESAKPLRFAASRSSGEVSALLLRPHSASLLLVLGHGAGAGMQHPFMEAIATRLASRGMATFRYQFPYMEKRSGRPDPPAIATATVRAAVEAAQLAAPDLPLLAGGKSFGGRMTSTAASQQPLAGVRGLVFFGFPLHAAGRPSSGRAAHLDQVAVPMLFLQGTRDALADLDLLRPVCERLGSRATLAIVDGADHSFHVLKKSGRTDDQVLDVLADATTSWAQRLEAGT